MYDQFDTGEISMHGQLGALGFSFKNLFKSAKKAVKGAVKVAVSPLTATAKFIQKPSLKTAGNMFTAPIAQTRHSIVDPLRDTASFFQSGGSKRASTARTVPYRPVPVASPVQQTYSAEQMAQAIAAAAQNAVAQSALQNAANNAAAAGDQAAYKALMDRLTASEARMATLQQQADAATQRLAAEQGQAAADAAASIVADGATQDAQAAIQQSTYSDDSDPWAAMARREAAADAKAQRYAEDPFARGYDSSIDPSLYADAFDAGDGGYEYDDGYVEGIKIAGLDVNPVIVGAVAGLALKRSAKGVAIGAGLGFVVQLLMDRKLLPATVVAPATEVTKPAVGPPAALAPGLNGLRYQNGWRYVPS